MPRLNFSLTYFRTTRPDPTLHPPFPPLYCGGTVKSCSTPKNVWCSRASYWLRVQRLAKLLSQMMHAHGPSRFTFEKVLHGSVKKGIGRDDDHAASATQQTRPAKQIAVINFTKERGILLTPLLVESFPSAAILLVFPSHRVGDRGLKIYISQIIIAQVLAQQHLVRAHPQQSNSTSRTAKILQDTVRT